MEPMERGERRAAPSPVQKNTSGFLKGVVTLLFLMVALMCVGTMGLVYFTEVLMDKYFFNVEAAGVTTDYESVLKPSTTNLEDLIVKNEHSEEEALALVMKHGVAMVPSVLSLETAAMLRAHVLKVNAAEALLYVMNGEHRKHLGLGVYDDASITRALQEIGSHPVLRPLVGRVLGPDAALVSMSVITNSYGAEDQEWHPDNDWEQSASTRPEIFAATYTIAINLQDTTKEMGATGVCPGTHKGWWDFNPDHCELQATSKAGGALFFNSMGMHRGVGHKDPGGLDRAVLFLTLADLRPDSARMLSMGNLYTLRWDLWGHSFSELATVATDHWSPRQALGMRYRHTGARAWNYLDFMAWGLVNGKDNTLIEDTHNVQVTHDDIIGYTSSARLATKTSVLFFAVVSCVFFQPTIRRLRQKQDYAKVLHEFRTSRHVIFAASCVGILSVFYLSLDF